MASGRPPLDVVGLNGADGGAEVSDASADAAGGTSFGCVDGGALGAKIVADCADGGGALLLLVLVVFIAGNVATGGLMLLLR